MCSAVCALPCVLCRVLCRVCSGAAQTLHEIMYQQQVMEDLSPLQFMYTFVYLRNRPPLPPPPICRCADAQGDSSRRGGGGGDSLGVDVEPDEANALIIEILISSCWQHSADARPLMTSIVQTLMSVESSCVVPSAPTSTDTKPKTTNKSFGWGYIAAAVRKVCRSWRPAGDSSAADAGAKDDKGYEAAGRRTSAAQDAAAVVNPAALREDPRGVPSPLVAAALQPNNFSAKVVPGMSMASGSSP